jgi:uncharacterized membrane-anchored protein YhcB (DUF1043 family)
MMTWELTAQIIGIAGVYVGGLFAVAHFVTNSLGKRIDDSIKVSEKRVDDARNDMKQQFSALRDNMNQNSSALRDDMNRIRVHYAMI